MKAFMYHCMAWIVICPSVLLANLSDPNRTASDPQDVWTDVDVTEETEKLLFMDIPMVISASRQLQKLEESSIPVSVITAEDIRYSGQTNLYEVLQFAPGVDMLQIDRNRYALGVRGLHDTWSDRTLTLINGRAADNPAFGGSEFLRLPLLLEDIKQIEVLRGPAGSAWGANAYNGAINIITKTPQECKGVYMSSGANLFGDNYHQMRWADGTEKWAWRLSGRYEDMLSSSDILDRQFLTTYSSVYASRIFESQDFRRSHLFDTELYHYLTEDTTLSGGIGYSKMATGGNEFMYTLPFADNTYETTRAFAKMEHRFDDLQKLTLQWYGNYQYNYWPQEGCYHLAENQLEAQLDIDILPDHRTTVGGSFRFTDIEQTALTAADMFIDERYEKRWGGFIVDKWSLTDRFSIETQMYGERFSQVGTDWAGRLSGLYALDEEHNHIIRLSGAKSYRTPLVALEGISMNRWGGWLRLVPNQSLDDEQIWSVETGYIGKFHPQWTWRVDGYWQEYHEMIGFNYIGLGRFQALPMGRAESYGAETEIIFHDDWIELSCWYAFNYFVPEGPVRPLSDSAKVRAFLPSKHKAGTTIRLFLPDDFVFNINMKHSALTENFHGPLWGPRPRPFDRLDLTLSKKVKLGDIDGEFMVGVSDLFNTTEERIGDQVSPVAIHETPGRTCFARMSFEF